MKDRIYRYLLEAGGRAPTSEVLRCCAAMVGEAGAVEEPLADWIALDPRFEVDGAELRLAEGHEEPVRLPLEETVFVVVDLETTGTRDRDTITEFGAVRIRRGLIEESWSTLVDPGVRIPGHITRLTGISDEMLEGQPSIAEALPVFLSFLGDAVLVAHNAPFDRGFLRRARRALQGMEIENRTLCTVRLARSLLPRLKSKNLDSLALHFGIPVQGRHRALGDAMATARILLGLIDLARRAGDRTLGDLVRRGGL